MASKDTGTHQVVIIAVLSVVIVLLVILLLLLVIYIAVLKWNKNHQRHRPQHDVERPTSLFHHQPSNCIITQAISSMTDYRVTRANENTKVNPAYVSDFVDEELQSSPALGCGPCDVDANGHGNDLNVTNEQFNVLTPDSCGSGRLDSELTELLKTDMTESVTVEVDSKLLVFMSREIDDTGGTLVLDKMGISLLIPPCAIPRGQKKIVQLVLDWDLSDFPAMKDTQTIISPVIHCGPHGLKLAKPAILSFMHCADDVKDIVVLSSETHLTQDKYWNPLQPLKKCGKVEYALLENQCQVYLSHFSLYTCIAEGPHSQLTKKWIQLAAFGKKEGGQFQVFIYMLNNTPCALQFATQQQAKYNCSMLRCPLEFLIDEEGGDLIFDLKHVSEGWNPIGHKWEEIGFFPDIWQGKCNNISFTFKHDNPACTDLNFSICLFQKKMADVKRCFEVAMSFQIKSPTRNTRRVLHPTTNLSFKLSQALPSVLINGFDSGISTTASETTSFKSMVMDHYPVGPVTNSEGHTYNDDQSYQIVVSDCCGDQAYDGSEDSDEDDDDDNEDLEDVTSTTKETHRGNGRVSEVTTREKRSRTHSGMSNRSTKTTNINILTGTVVQPTTSSLDHRQLLQDDPPTSVFPLRLRSKLIALLDPPCPLASTVNDWRVLAESLNLDSLVSLIRMKPSPTEELLDVAAQKGKDCQWLLRVLRDAERYDAADEVAKYLGDGCESVRPNHHMDKGDSRCRNASVSETLA